MEALNFKGISRKATNRATSAKSARTYEEETKSKRKGGGKRNNRSHSRSESRDSSSSSETDDDEWIQEVDEAKTVEEAMHSLWKSDPETFYIYGERVMRMVQYKLERDWRLPNDE